MDILIDLYQQGRIREAQSTADQARSATRTVEWQMQDLKRKVQSLTITCQALWELLSERLNLDEHLVLQKMQEIDLRDGRADGKISTSVVSCPSCSRPNKASRNQCLYCGSTLPTSHIFDKS